MRKFILIYGVVFLLNLYGANWYEKNKFLSVVFHRDVWKYIEKANYYTDTGNYKYADIYLRKAKEKTENCEPFNPKNWPNNWPMDKENLKYLKYATPTAFIYRIIGDFCLERGYIKEAIKYFEMYINKSLIPESSYYILLAELYERESLFNQAINLYREMERFIENKNYWGKDYSLEEIEKRIKNLNLSLKKNSIIILTPLYINIPSFLEGEFFDIFLNEVKGIKNINVIPRSDFEKVLNEQKFVEKSIEDEELSVCGKILNADYVLKPSLTKILDVYVLGVDIFSVNKKNWFEHFEYKTEDIKYIPNLIKRFALNFQGLDITPDLYLPENKFLWSYETDSLIKGLKISSDGKKILVGCESGSVYLLSDKGGLLKYIKFPDKIVNLAISPSGDYFSVFTLEGKLYFLSENGKILWVNKTGNYGRGLDISENGKFLVAGIDKKLFYMDRKGEIFWEVNLPDFISFLNITENSELVFAGTEGGNLYCYKDDGNLNWEKNIKEKIVNIKTKGNYVCVETEKGRIYLYDVSGSEIKNFKVDEEINLNIYNEEILNLLSGKKGNFMYFLSYDKKSLWKYTLEERISYLSSLPDGKLIVSVEGKNIFAFSIMWK